MVMVVKEREEMESLDELSDVVNEMACGAVALAHIFAT